MEAIKRFFGGGKKERVNWAEKLYGSAEVIHESNVRTLKSQGIEPLSYEAMMAQIKQLYGEVDPTMVRLGDMAENFSFYNLGSVTVCPEGGMELRRAADLVGGRFPIEEPPIRLGVSEPYFSLAVIEIPSLEHKYDEIALIVDSAGQLVPFERRWKKLRG